MTKCSLVWFRQDLRLKDNPTISRAVKRQLPILPLYIWAPHEEGPWTPGAASKVWLHSSLAGLQRSLQEMGSALRIFKTGPGETYASTEELLTILACSTNMESLFYSRRYEPAAIERDSRVRDKLMSAGFQTEDCKDNLLFEPWEIATKTGQPFQIFTPFWKSCVEKLELAREMPTDLVGSLPPKRPELPEWLKPLGSLPGEVSLEELELIPRQSWVLSLQKFLDPGEEAAQKKLKIFLEKGLEHYEDRRDYPELNGCSQLSSHLHFGEISVQQVYETVRNKIERERELKSALKKGSSYSHSSCSAAFSLSAQTFLKELGWREFAHHLLYHFPHTDLLPLNKKFSDFPWQKNEQFLSAWQKGETGYPIIDAGMRELRQTGLMHNRVRMLVSSFLVKDLLLPWQAGSTWFWNNLVDADLAQNSLGWQWSAGCGADAAPYFRIFNPCLQGKKFDPEGNYVRRFVPELSKLPNKYIHEPWRAEPAELEAWGIILGKTYPQRLVNHQEARQRALAIYQDLKKTDLLRNESPTLGKKSPV